MALDQEAVAAALPLYEVEGELGRGAWGVVLAGRHRQLGRDVAIKQLPRAFGTDPAVRNRFIAEARLLASLEHPHIVPIYDFVEREGLCLLVMERLSGGTVWNRARAQRFTPQGSCATVLATCSALHYAHQRGVLHRDVKPENLMFSGKGDLKVTDFGIAKVVAGAATVATRTGDVLGTPAYMAPEQAQGSELSPATDIYAVGTVLYELLSGQLPFPEDSNPIAMLYRHVHEDPEPLLQIASHVPEDVAAVTTRSLERDPADRYHDAQEFAVAVAEAACRSWGPGWLPATGMTVSAAGPVLGAATGQTARIAETMAPRHDTPRETPVGPLSAPADLVPISELHPDLASSSRAAAAASSPPPSPPSPPPSVQETQAAARVARPSPPPPPVPAAPAPAAPPSPPPPPPRPPSRRRWLLGGLPVAVALVIALIVALLVSGGSKKKTGKTQPAAPAATAASGGAETSPWRPVRDSPTARQEVASTVADGVVWVFGGLTGNASTPKVEGYDPAINTWKSAPDLPLAVHHAMAATFKGELVVMGGWVPEAGNLTARTSDRVFALRNGVWAQLPPMNRPRAAGATTVVGNRLVVVGGQADGQLVPQTEIFDGTRWTDAPAILTPRDHLAAVSDDRFVYAIGGRNLSADKNLAAFERFDTATLRWTKGPPLPTPRGGLGAAIVNGRIFAAGGETPTDVLGTVEVFDTAGPAWTSAAPMRTPRHGVAVEIVGSNLFAIDGGRRPGHAQATKIAETLPL